MIITILKGLAYAILIFLTIVSIITIIVISNYLEDRYKGRNANSIFKRSLKNDLKEAFREIIPSVAFKFFTIVFMLLGIYLIGNIGLYIFKL